MFILIIFFLPFPRNFKDPIRPIVEINHRRGRVISDVQWNSSNENEIAVSYKSFSQVDIYDLTREIMKPKLVLETGRTTTDGLACLLWYQHTFPSAVSDATSTIATNSVPQYLSKLVVGSQSGMIRCWEVSENKSKRCLWEASCDSTNNGSVGGAVIGLVLLSEPGHMAALTRYGLLSIFDLSRMAKSAFSGGGGGPLLLRRLDLRPILHLRQQTDVVIGLKTGSSLRHNHSNHKNSNKYSSQERGYDDNSDVITVTTSTGTVATMHLRSNRMLCGHFDYSTNTLVRNILRCVLYIYLIFVGFRHFCVCLLFIIFKIRALAFELI